MSLAPDTVVDGKYRIIRTLGEGGVGVVYVAEHTFLRKQVALKVLRAEMAQFPEVAVRFEQEARAASLIEHPNIVRVTDFGKTKTGELYLVMELLPGRALSDEMAYQPKVERDRALWITKEVLRGLEGAHAVGIVHRDLKPENVLIVNRPDFVEQVKLVDFGIAKLRHEDSVRLTQTGTVLGTPQYMAPEQARGLSDLDHRVDLHACGVMLYEMLSGRPPYTGDNYNIVLYEILNGTPPPLGKVAPEVDPVLAKIVMKSFHPDRDLRFQTAKDMRETLEQYSETLKARASAFDSPPSGSLRQIPGGGVPAGTSGPGLTPLSLEVVPIGTHDQPRVVSLTGVSGIEPSPSQARTGSTAQRSIVGIGGSIGAGGGGGAGGAATSGAQSTGGSALALAMEPDRFAPLPVEPNARTTPLPPPPAPQNPFEPAPAPQNPFEPPPVGGGLHLDRSGRGWDNFEVQSSGVKGSHRPSTERRSARDLALLEDRPAPAAKRSSAGWIVLGLLLLGGGGAAVFLQAPASAPSVAAHKVTLTLDGLPENAVVSFDGVRRFINPLEVEASSSTHELRIECEGYKTRVLRVKPASSQVLDARLERAGSH